MTILISHRGNLNGPELSLENHPNQIDLVIKAGFDCEIDLRIKNDDFFLGHDEPIYKISMDWLVERNQSLWVHCKDFRSLEKLQESNNSINYFWHQTDDFTITSKGQIWTFPGKSLGRSSIAVLPESIKGSNLWSESNLRACFGLCTDFPEKYKTSLS